MDDRMDELLEELSPPQEVDINPWRRPIRLLAWGFLLTTVTLNFWNLDRLLPGLGMILMLLGLRSLRRENGGFRTAWVLAILRLALLAVWFALDATPYRDMALTYWLNVVQGILLQLWQILAIRSGLGRVFDKAGAERRLGAMNWLVALQVLVAVLGLLNVGEVGLAGLPLLALYVGIIVALFKLPRTLEDTGYALRNAPVRLGDLPAALLGTAALAVLVVAAYFAGIALCILASQPYTPEPDPALAGRLPEDILELLTPEEAALFEDAVEIEYAPCEAVDFPDGTKIEFGTAVGELPGARLLILQTFRYLEGGPKYGDGFSCWTSQKLYQTIRPDTGDPQPTGALVYELEGETRRAPIRDLYGGYARIQGILWDNSGDRVSGNVYAPRDAENLRGYALYLVEHRQDSLYIYNCCMDFLHNGLFDTYRRGTPTDMLFTGGFDYDWRFQHLTKFKSFGQGEEDLPPEDAGFTVIEQ